MTELTVVIPFRNREPERVVNAWRSVKAHTSLACKCIVSDLGSRPEILAALKTAALEEDFLLLENQGQGLPFNKARAVNIGAKAAETELVCVLDADMRLFDGVLDYIAGKIKVDEVYYLENRWPNTAKADPKRSRIALSYGVFQVLHRVWFERLCGFNEAIEFWGDEDNDWARRLRDHGVKQIILGAKDFYMTHVWHVSENQPSHRPKTAEWHTLELELRSALTGMGTQGWGKQISFEDRPILAKMKQPKTAHVIDLTGWPLVDHFVEVDKLVREHGFVHFRFGPRIRTRKLSRFNRIQSLVAPLLDPFSLEVEPVVNGNLETFLVACKVWKDILKDRYLSDDFSEAWILVETK